MKFFLSFFISVLNLASCASAEKIIYSAKGRIYAYDLERRREKVIAEVTLPDRISSVLVLPRTKQVIYSVKSRDQTGAVLWQSNLDGGSAKRLLETQYSNLELCDFSPDERRIVFQGKKNDTSIVTYLNLGSGKQVQLQDASSPRFLSNTKLIVLTSSGFPSGWYNLLARWDVAQQTLDTLSYSEDISQRAVNLSPKKDRLAVTRSTAGIGINEYIDILDTIGQILVNQAASSTGLIGIIGGPDFSPDGRYISWVHEHWLKLTDLQTKETKRIAERLVTDETAWSPDGEKIASAFAAANLEKCINCWSVNNSKKRMEGLFLMDKEGDWFEIVREIRGVEKQIFWVK